MAGVLGIAFAPISFTYFHLVVARFVTVLRGIMHADRAKAANLMTFTYFAKAYRETLRAHPKVICEIGDESLIAVVNCQTRRSQKTPKTPTYIFENTFSRKSRNSEIRH